MQRDAREGREDAGDIRVRGVQLAVAADDGVHRADAFGERVEAVDEAEHGFLVRDGDVGAQQLGGAQALERDGEVGGRDVPRLVPGVDSEGIEGGLLEARRDRVGDRVAEEGDALRHGNWYRCTLALCSASVEAKACEPSPLATK